MEPKNESKIIFNNFLKAKYNINYKIWLKYFSK